MSLFRRLSELPNDLPLSLGPRVPTLKERLDAKRRELAPVIRRRAFPPTVVRCDSQFVVFQDADGRMYCSVDVESAPVENKAMLARDKPRSLAFANGQTFMLPVQVVDRLRRAQAKVGLVDIHHQPGRAEAEEDILAPLRTETGVRGPLTGKLLTAARMAQDFGMRFEWSGNGEWHPGHARSKLLFDTNSFYRVVR